MMLVRNKRENVKDIEDTDRRRAAYAITSGCDGASMAGMPIAQRRLPARLDYALSE